MLQPSYTQLMEKLNEDAQDKVVTSRYSIIIAAARRARQIIDIVNEESNVKNGDKEAAPIDPIRIKEAAELNEKLKYKKSTSIAVDELYAGKIKIKELAE
ncbi:MAG: DNA-directed RNA polymerase subunit omega [Niameybacter sp.]|uniref:DNA-directed RNA polymerase subunit omega n=1 Tax=Niameybacter sp. TaxID=2033640 RepID=UPI002FCAC3E1